MNASLPSWRTFCPPGECLTEIKRDTSGTRAPIDAVPSCLGGVFCFLHLDPKSAYALCSLRSPFVPNRTAPRACSSFWLTDVHVTTPAPQVRSPEPLRVVYPCWDYLVRIAHSSSLPRKVLTKSRKRVYGAETGGCVCLYPRPRPAPFDQSHVGIDRDAGGNSSQRPFALQDGMPFTFSSGSESTFIFALGLVRLKPVNKAQSTDAP